MERPNVPPAEELRFRARMRTRWSDEDNQAVLNNAVYLTLFEEARHAYFSGLDLMDGARFPFLLAQTNVRYLHPGRGGVEVEVQLGTQHLGTTSFRQAYRVRELDGPILCEAEALLVCVAADGQKRALDARFREAVTSFEQASHSAVQKRK